MTQTSDSIITFAMTTIPADLNVTINLCSAYKVGIKLTKIVLLKYCKKNNS